MHPVGQHFLAALRETQITPEVRDLILKEKVLGFTLFKWNIVDADQLKDLCDELQSLAKQAGYELILAVDQEGGKVERLPKPYLQIPSMRKWRARQVESGQQDLFYKLGKLLGEEVRLAGFNLDFAPVVDVNTEKENPIIGSRSFSDDPQVVFECARDLSQGLIDAGVIPCLKHFPGHGATVADSHLELPLDDRDFQTLQNLDLLPYHKLIEEGLAPTLMTAHVKYTQVDKDVPATLSPTILTDLLRREMGYEGLVFSDDFLMKAIFDHYGLHDACLKFFQCGGDVVLICKYPDMALKLIHQLRSELKGGLLENKLKSSYERIAFLKKQYLSKAPELGNRNEVLSGHKAFLDSHFPDFEQR